MGLNLHKHPLILSDQPNDGGGGGAKVPCDGCLLPLSGASSYNCKQCEFFLHKVCAELPNKIIHFLHPKHPLTLLPKTPYIEGNICDNCSDRLWGFSYHCSICNFYLCIQCVLVEQIVEHEGHEHSFKLLRKTNFRCDACDERSEDISCVCTTCLLLVHKTCASLPPTIKHVDHDHPLNLTQCIPLDDDPSCNACDCDVNTHYWYYSCASCTYIVHLDCVTSETKLGDELNELGSASASVPNECTIDLITNDLNDISLNNIDNDVNEASLTKIERVTELQHFSHEQHSLTLSNDEPDSEEICDGCVRTISAPYYKCAQCNYFLHVSCAELPNNIRHLLHPHSLTLFSVETANFSLFACSACSQYFNGFAYACRICEFYIDVICSSVSGILKHEAHEHTLSLDQKIDGSWCEACSSRCDTKFRCEPCYFTLDLRCAALPSSVRHEWDKHPLKLTFSTIKGKLGTYYCDFCQEQRSPSSDWFYYCEDCDVAGHPQCLLGQHMMIKFGKSNTSDFCPHLVTLVKNTSLPHRSDEDCDHEKDTFLIECADCNVHDHLS